MRAIVVGKLKIARVNMVTFQLSRLLTGERMRYTTTGRQLVEDGTSRDTSQRLFDQVNLVIEGTVVCMTSCQDIKRGVAATIFYDDTSLDYFDFRRSI